MGSISDEWILRLLVATAPWLEGSHCIKDLGSVALAAESNEEECRTEPASTRTIDGTFELKSGTTIVATGIEGF